ncbi:MAG: 4'-phosphopantetheinyl transferase superfamily protein [Proteobacteria bacterium]|nr:4'-phosphopantetheinyl transferase superfamily protein [Pseudomonadota bacterium]MBU1716913.1 4'-phosphopantetheinyl transferase superfamily protein [Pseudomonadota bacterium]
MNVPTINLDPGLTADDYRKISGPALPPSLVFLSLDRLKEMIEISGDQTFTEHFLAPDEVKHYTTFHYPKRKIEWLAGRIAAKQAAVYLLTAASHQEAIIAPKGILIRPDKNGRPYLTLADKNADQPCPDISITHSKGLAAAMAVQGSNCGIDLQQISEAVVRVQDRFASDAEYELIARHLEFSSEKKADGLTLLWSAKEALRKGIGGHPLTGFLQMELTDMIEIKPGKMRLDFIVGKEKKIRARTISFFYNDYGCSLTMVGPRATSS